MWRATFLALIPASQCLAQTVLIVGPETTTGCLGPQVSPALAAAGFNVMQIGDVSDLDSTDLSGFDVVWLPNGIASDNPGCPDVEPIPGPAGAANLAQFLADGGGVYLAGEDDTANQNQFLLWRDDFIENVLGGGAVDGTCVCSLGVNIYLDPTHEINTTPSSPGLIAAQTQFTGGFENVGTGVPIAYASADLTGTPIAVVWEQGSMTFAPAGRLVVFNNSNNGTGFVDWAVNVATWLAGPSCVGDWNGDGLLQTNDFIAYLNDYNLAGGGNPPVFGNPDIASPIGVLNTSDFIAYLNAYNAGCPS